MSEFHYTYDPNHHQHQNGQKPVVNLNTRDVYPSINDVAKAFGVNYGPVRAIALGIKYKGYYWQYKDVVDQSSVEELLKVLEEKSSIKSRSKWRAVVNLNTGDYYDSIKQAELSCFDDPEKWVPGIQRSINTHTAYRGYYWQYKDIVDQSSVEEQLQAILSVAKHSTARPVVNLNTGQEFESCRAVQRFYNAKSSVSGFIKQDIKYHGYYWQYKDVVDRTSIKAELSRIELLNEQRAIQYRETLKTRSKRQAKVRHYTRNELSSEWDAIEGSKYRKLLCVRFDEHRSKEQKKYIFECRCDCGKTVYLDYRLFARKSATIKSCGCAIQDYANDKLKTAEDITGNRYGKLVAMRFNEEATLKRRSEKRYAAMWDCICDCGNYYTTKKSLLVSGSVTSCGHITSSSTWEQTICTSLHNLFPLFNIKYQYQDNSQLRLNYIKEDGTKGCYRYDCTINDKYIIECNGTAFHPKTIDQTFEDGRPWKTVFGKDCRYAYEYDKQKMAFARSKGYKTFTVWDDQPLDEIIKQIVNWLQQEGAFADN